MIGLDTPCAAYRALQKLADHEVTGLDGLASLIPSNWAASDWQEAEALVPLRERTKVGASSYCWRACQISNLISTKRSVYPHVDVAGL